MLRIQFKLFMLLFICSYPLTLKAEEMSENQAMQQRSEREGCSEEELKSYFPKRFVLEVLKKYNVPEDQRNKIQGELAAKNPDIIPTIETAAEKMNPNPLTDPKYRDQAVKIFRETIFDSFSSVLKKYNFTDKAQVQMMLNDIQEMKAKQFSKCMEHIKEDDFSR